MNTITAFDEPVMPARAHALAALVGSLLDRVPGSRAVLPRMAELERGLLERGLEALNDNPLPSLAHMLEQLRSLSPQIDDSALEIHALLLASVDRRVRPRSAGLKTYVSNEQLFVGEASHSAFMDALQVEGLYR